MEPAETPPVAAVNLQLSENAIGSTADILQPQPQPQSQPPVDEVDSLAVTGSSDDVVISEIPSDDDFDHHEDRDQGQVENLAESDVVVPVDELKQKIIRQVEYYFSDENLPTDKFLLNAMKKTKNGFVPISTIATFHKMKKLTRDHALIVSALKESSFLVVSQDGKKVKRLPPLPEVRDPKIFTVLVENLPEDHSDKNIREIFGTAGRIKSITICDPNAAEESEKGCKDTFITPRLHAFVEYETVEAAEKAASTLNDVQDWRNGLRVKLLDQTGKFAQRRPARKEVDIEKDKTGGVHDQTGVEENKKPNEHQHHSHHHHHHHSDTLADEDGGHNKGRGRGRGRRQNHQGGNGHGTVPSASSSSHHNHNHNHHPVEVSKRPPGPKMPDGTRGFTTGRGKPLPPPSVSAQTSHEVC